ncbi:MAG: hypothetical protein ACLSFC_05140 [Enterocloster bolteae]
MATVIAAVEDERERVMDQMGCQRTRAVGQIYALLGIQNIQVAQFRVLAGPVKGV